jgi:valyl-tRNA synthetase
VMDLVLSNFLRRLHPFMPHITEELWLTFGFETTSFGATDEQKSSIMFASATGAWIDVNWRDALENPAQADQARLIYDGVRSARNLRAEYRVASNRRILFVLRPIQKWVQEDVRTMARLMGASELRLDEHFKPAPGTPMVVIPHGELYMPLDGVVDMEAERERLDKEITKLENELRVVEAKLANAAFVDKAPPAVVQEHRQRKTDFSEQLAQLRKARVAMD